MFYNPDLYINSLLKVPKNGSHGASFAHTTEVKVRARGGLGALSCSMWAI